MGFWWEFRLSGLANQKLREASVVLSDEVQDDKEDRSFRVEVYA